jgi:excinuclease ABC subunit B
MNILGLSFFGDEVETITKHEYLTNNRVEELEDFILYSVNPFIVTQDRLAEAIKKIEDELSERLDYFVKEDKIVEYQRLKQRVEFDLEMLESTGMCKGIENYSRLLTDKKEGETPYSLIDYFEAMGRDYLIIVDESHVSLSQFRGMYAGDRSRKTVLVDYGFRLPSALDNRPLMYDEYINKNAKFLFVSATPSDTEIELSSTVAEQIIRPTGLLDPIIEVIDSEYQVERLHDEIKKVVERNERVLVTVLTKKMAEELTTYYNDVGLRVKYMHSDIDAIERNQIIRQLRLGKFDVLVGINLLREGLDIPEASLVAILDADKEGFLRSKTSLVQTMGRAARNSNGKVLLFAKKMTDSMKYAIETTENRRKIQEEHNKKHGITPTTTIRKLDEDLKMEEYDTTAVKQERLNKMPAKERQKMLKELNTQMTKAAKDLNFEEAIRLRDEIEKIKKL